MPRKSALTIAEEKIASLEKENESMKKSIGLHIESENQYRIRGKIMEARLFMETYNTSDTAAFLIGEKEDGGLIFVSTGNSLMLTYAFYALIKEEFSVDEDTMTKIYDEMGKTNTDNEEENKDEVFCSGTQGSRWLDLYSAMHKWNPGVNEKPSTYMIPAMLDFNCEMNLFEECKYYYLVCIVDRTEYPEWRKFYTMDICTREKDIIPALDIYMFDGCHYTEAAQVEYGITEEARIRTVARAIACFARNAYLPTSIDKEKNIFMYNQAAIVGVKGVESILKCIIKDGSDITQKWANVHKNTCRMFDLYSEEYMKTDKYGYMQIPFITMYPGLGWSYETKHMIETFWPGYYPPEK